MKSMEFVGKKQRTIEGCFPVAEILEKSVKAHSASMTGSCCSSGASGAVMPQSIKKHKQ